MSLLEHCVALACIIVAVTTAPTPHDAPLPREFDLSHVSVERVRTWAAYRQSYEKVYALHGSGVASYEHKSANSSGSKQSGDSRAVPPEVVRGVVQALFDHQFFDLTDQYAFGRSITIDEAEHVIIWNHHRSHAEQTVITVTIGDYRKSVKFFRRGTYPSNLKALDEHLAGLEIELMSKETSDAR